MALPCIYNLPFMTEKLHKLLHYILEHCSSANTAWFMAKTCRGIKPNNMQFVKNKLVCRFIVRAFSDDSDYKDDWCMWITNRTLIGKQQFKYRKNLSQCHCHGTEPAVVGSMSELRHCLARYLSLTCNHTCASDLATVYRFLCFTCSRLLIRSIAAKQNTCQNETHCTVIQRHIMQIIPSIFTFLTSGTLLTQMSASEQSSESTAH